MEDEIWVKGRGTIELEPDQTYEVVLECLNCKNHILLALDTHDIGDHYHAETTCDQCGNVVEYYLVAAGHSNEVH